MVFFVMDLALGSRILNLKLEIIVQGVDLSQDHSPKGERSDVLTIKMMNKLK